MTMSEPDSHDVSPPALTGGPLVLSDVYLLTAESGGSVAVPGLTVHVDTAALTVRKPDGTVGAVVAWTDVSGLAANKRMRTPAGSPGVIVEAMTASRTHRFVVPSDNPDGLEYELTRLAEAGRSGGGAPLSRGKGRSGLLTGILLVAIVAVIALGVLLATGTVKF